MKKLILALALLSVMAAAAQARPNNAAGGGRAAGSGRADQVEFDSCYARWSEGELVIGNRHIERRWRIENGLLFAASFRDKASGTEWVLRPANRPAPLPRFALTGEKRAVRFASRNGARSPVEAASLVIEMTADGAGDRLQYRFQIFPAAHGVGVQLIADSRSAVRPQPQGASGEGGAGAPAPTGIEQNAAPGEQQVSADTLEDFEFAPRHLRLVQVSLADQTDIRNELVHEQEWLLHASERLRLTGNLFYAEDTLTGAGLLFLKQAPLPHARPVRAEYDFVLDPRGMSLPFPKVDPATGTLAPSDAKATGYRVSFTGQGTDERGGEGYPFVTLAYAGGRVGRIAALQTYQRQLRQYDATRDGMFLSNTWGDRSRDARINHDFIAREIAAGNRLGVDVVQIDDGWQQGRTQNSARAGGVWNGFWASDPNFWEVNTTRFPAGLAPLVGEARRKNMNFGLWFAPDSSDGGANWERDADQILKLHRTLGINYIKLDAVKATTKSGEENFRRFYDKVLRESNGRVVFDLDVTAEIRPGYFGAMAAGPIFVENRYTDARRYFPHQTLRNLWSLAQYVDPLRLRIEFLNNARNRQAYGDDPLAPAAYRPAYLFATTMMANPLGWFETSNLPESYIDEVAGLVRAWKAHRAEMFADRIIPIGEKPDGTSWTGFASVGADARSGYLLIFRELNRTSEVTLDVPALTGTSYRIDKLGGTGTASLAGGRLKARVPEAQSFLFLRASAE